MRGVGAAACWLYARAGVIEAVKGSDEARGIAGVQSVVVNARPGDLVRHLENSESRDRLGYVLAIGATFDVALRTAEAGCRMIDIRTCATTE